MLLSSLNTILIMTYLTDTISFVLKIGDGKKFSEQIIILPPD